VSPLSNADRVTRAGRRQPDGLLVSHLPDLSRQSVVEQLAERIVRLDLPARIAIDGPDAAGKTTLAEELATLLGAGVTRIGADAYLRPPEERYRRGRESPEGYYDDAVDHEALRASVVEASRLVIVDGVFLLRPELDDLWSLRVFVEISEEESLRRGVRRDGALHTSPEVAEHLYRARYLPAQRMYQALVRPRDRADVVVVNESPAVPQLLVGEGLRQSDS
jgi:uridine kinase